MGFSILEKGMAALTRVVKPLTPSALGNTKGWYPGKLSESPVSVWQCQCSSIVRTIVWKETLLEKRPLVFHRRMLNWGAITLPRKKLPRCPAWQQGYPDHTEWCRQMRKSLTSPWSILLRLYDLCRTLQSHPGDKAAFTDWWKFFRDEGTL